MRVCLQVYLSGLIGRPLYYALYARLNAAVISLHGDAEMRAAVREARRLEASSSAASMGSGGPGSADDGDDGADLSTAGRVGVITASEEPRFVCHRFWNVYASMLHCPYIATRLDTWRADGAREYPPLTSRR